MTKTTQIVSLETVAKKVARDMSSNMRIHATNAYLKSQGVHVNDFLEHSSTFLTVDQYASVQLPGFEFTQRLIGPFGSYGLLQNFKRSNESKETLGPGLEHTRLRVMDTFAWVNEWSNMGRRWSDAMAKATIDNTHLLIRRPCMLVVAERLMDDTRCSTG